MSPTLSIRARRSCVFLCRHSSGGVPHVVPARLDLSLSDTSEDLIDIVVALRGKSVSDCANFIHNRVTTHRRFPPSVLQDCKSREIQPPCADRRIQSAFLPRN